MDGERQVATTRWASTAAETISLERLHNSCRSCLSASSHYESGSCEYTIKTKAFSKKGFINLTSQRYCNSQPKIGFRKRLMQDWTVGKLSQQAAGAVAGTE